MTDKKDEPSLEGLDEFARKFLLQESDQVSVSKGPGHGKTDKQLEHWLQFRVKEFVERAGSLCEDTMSFFSDTKQSRGFDNQEAVFALALMSINFRNSWGYDPRSEEEEKKGVPPAVAQERLQEFDKICFFAQKYYDENKDKS